MEESLYYPDKSSMIEEVIEDTNRVLLLPRPRRFGKTLNMTMLRCFFEKHLPEYPEKFPDNRSLFEGLEIESRAVFKRHQGKHPVIYLSFKGNLLSKEYRRHDCLLRAKNLNEEDHLDYSNIIKRKYDQILHESSLCKLTRHLHDFYKKKCWS